MDFKTIKKKTLTSRVELTGISWFFFLKSMARSSPGDVLHLKMIAFKNKQSIIEIDLLGLEDDKSLPSYGDARIMISVSSNGFSGNNDLWVSTKALREFCSNLIELEKNRFGKAILESMSPDELNLKIFSIDSLGHIGIQGVTGHNIFSENISFQHCVRFGFEFDPSQLILAVKEGWV